MFLTELLEITYSQETTFTLGKLHSCIYVGGNKVIHFTAPETPNSSSGWIISSSSSSSSSSYPQPGNRVSICSLDGFIGSGSLYVYKYGASKLDHFLKLRNGTMTIVPSDPP
ncbi:hypothetical protein L1987_56181 [Smallanthus sonchifolius]|uniref:Uncharacterized protein n=1 Tax=Smallanthus sonchifolius TaxID=185202 RepID=A0ACB9EC52_9ASTR|nr:hypothetical protein L1987_56181 [Smallanthus sonchifolius]